MESKEKHPNDELIELVGEITEYKSELSDSNYIETMEVEKGEFVEKYFNQKLKYLLESDVALSNTINLPQIKEELILSIIYSILNNSELDPKISKKIITKIDKYLKNETPIQIDSFLPMVDGKKVNRFISSIENYSFPSFEKIDENKKYTIIVESTFSLKSQIIKKSDQLRKSFLLFSLMQKLYKLYPKYIENYYKYFVRKYILKEEVEKQKMNIADDDLDLSPYGNYIFLIATNKTFKSFKGVEYITRTFSFKDDEEPDYSFKKCFEIDDGEKTQINSINTIEGKNSIKQNIIKSQKPEVRKIYQDENEYADEIKKVSNNKKLSEAYKSVNYLLENINKEKNCRAKMLYFDTYLNCITPKCLLLQKLEGISNDVKNQNKKIENVMKTNEELLKNNKELLKNNEVLLKTHEELKKMNKALMGHILKQNPDFDISRLKFN